MSINTENLVKTIKLSEITTEDFDCLANGECNEIFIPESDYGLAEIYYDKDKEGFALYEIPMYGGEPSLTGYFKEAQKVIDEMYKWC